MACPRTGTPSRSSITPTCCSRPASTRRQLKDLTWNAQDGGTFDELVAKLTLDANGKNGLDPAFDKANVVQYGFVPQGPGGFSGQTQWSMFAASNGFTLTDGPWTSKYYYDDPKLAETMQWWADLGLVKGFAPPLADYTTNGTETSVLPGGQKPHSPPTAPGRSATT